MKRNLLTFYSGIISMFLLFMGSGIYAQAPVITSVADITGEIGQPYSYDVEATGAAPIAFTLTKSPAGMTINGTTGVISWTPTDVNVDAKVVVTATNSVSSTTQSFIINLTELTACPAGATGLWQLNETSGNIYKDHYDVSDAVAGVPPVPSTGIVNGAQKFDAATTVEIPDNGSWDWTSNGSFSFEMWVKTTQNVAGSDYGIILGRYRHDEYPMTWLIGINKDEKPAFYLRDVYYGTGDGIRHDSLIIGPNSIADGVWHHIVAVRNDAVNKNIIYVDGVKAIEATINYAYSFRCDDIAGGVPVTLGYYDSGNGHHFVGDIDEVAIYSRALSDAEILANFNNRQPVGHCNSVNYAPVIKSTPNTSATQGTAYSYTFETDDYDMGDILTLSATTLPSWLTLNYTPGQRTATITGTPLDENVGNNAVTLKVTDNGTGTLSKTQSFTIAVANINDAPTITSTPTLTTDQGAEYSYVVVGNDVDGDALTYAAPTKPAWLTFDAATHTLSGTPAGSDVGTHDIVVSVTDGISTAVTQSFTLTVNSVNTAPVITGQSTLTVVKNNPIVLTLANLTVTDPDNTYPDDFTLVVLDGDNYSVAGSTVTPDNNYTGNINVGVQVDDGQDISGIYYVLIEVTVSSAVIDIDGNVLKVVAYPNPAKENISFAIDKSLENATIEIYSSVGSLVKKVNIDEEIETIDITELNSGTYFYTIKSNSEVVKGNFIVFK